MKAVRLRPLDVTDESLRLIDSGANFLVFVEMGGYVVAVEGADSWGEARDRVDEIELLFPVDCVRVLRCDRPAAAAPPKSEGWLRRLLAWVCGVSDGSQDDAGRNPGAV